jgi:CO/xanthine dehydrogenase Mo-binding subunit
MATPSIGQSPSRKEGHSKVTGHARYVDDVTMPGMIHGVTVRSACARGRIRGIHFGEGIPWDEVAVVVARDIAELARRSSTTTSPRWRTA